MPRIPPNAFGMAFGLAGLSEAWLTAAEAGLAPRSIGNALVALTAVAWLTLISSYTVAALARPGTLRADLVHPVLGPFLSLALIVPMLLAALGVEPHAHAVGTVLVDVLVALVVLHGSWFTGQLIYGDYPLDQIHPGYFLPTVAGGLLAATSVGKVGQHGLGIALFGYGALCWIILGSIILARLIVRPILAVALRPTLAIEVAPAAVATIAWFTLHAGRVDVVAQLLAGYGVLMVLAQLRLLPAFLRLQFALGFWSFTFSWAAVATAALMWLHTTRPAGHALWSWLSLGAVTVPIGSIAVRTALSLARDELFPPAGADGAHAAALPDPVPRVRRRVPPREPVRARSRASAQTPRGADLDRRARADGGEWVPGS